MKSGYDQFFKKARENAQQGARSAGASNTRFDVKNQRPRTNTNQEMAHELRGRVQSRRLQQKRRRRSGIPWKLVSVSFLGFLVAAAGYLKHDKIENLVKHLEVSALGQAMADEAPAPTAAAKEAPKGEAKPVAGDAKKVDDSAQKNYTDEELNHFTKLNERKRELDAREEELNRLEAELNTQKVELEKKITSLDKTRRDISSVLEERVQVDDKKVETLVQLYSNMKPQQAAKIFEEMDEDLAVDIVGRMKKKNAAEIMNLIKPEKAKVFAEKFAGYKRK